VLIVKCEMHFCVTHRRFNLHSVKVRWMDGIVWKCVWLGDFVDSIVKSLCSVTRKLCAAAVHLLLIQLKLECQR
jgi:hypothetical protein